MAETVKRVLHFEPEERKRLGAACFITGIAFEEFVRVSALHAADEVIGTNQLAQHGPNPNYDRIV